MRYFTKDFIDFLQELSQNNSKEWFDQNRKRYEESVKLPFSKFIEDLVIAIQGFDSSIHITPQKAIFRINRDIRFSPDKTPYKLHRSAVLGRANKKEEYPAYYIRIDSERLHIGGGLFNLSKDNLYKVREEIMYNEDQFKQAVEALAFIQKFSELKGQKNKILKPPFKEVAKESPILYHKQFYYMNNYDNKLILKNDLIPFIVDQLEAAYPLNQFLQFALAEE